MESKTDSLTPATSEPSATAPVRVQQVVLPHVLLHEGGEWLGAARTWLQWNTRNGDSVTWGSHDEIKPTITVKMVEELAAHVAAAAINADRRVRQNAELSGCGPLTPTQPKAEPAVR